MPTLTVEGLERVSNLIGEDIGYSAVGSGSRVESENDADLETFEAQTPTNLLNVSSGVIEHRTFYINGDLPDDVEEVGWYLDTANSLARADWTLLARALLTFTKDVQDLLLILNINIEQVE